MIHSMRDRIKTVYDAIDQMSYTMESHKYDLIDVHSEIEFRTLLIKMKTTMKEFIEEIGPVIERPEKR